ncbi:MAG: hypothetical protein IKW90_05775 [Lachnospiraceae bacterium]|nr:hypothetical protein [Lachnospiraceae bacterium]MBR5178288.1 hypothetical protein [Lachnospiraceae bacterium]
MNFKKLYISLVYLILSSVLIGQNLPGQNISQSINCFESEPADEIINEESTDAIELRIGKYVAKKQSVWYSYVDIEEDDWGGIGPRVIGLNQSIIRTKLKIEDGYLIITKFRFLIIDEKTIQYIQVENPDEEQKWIPDQTVYVLEE